MLTLHMVLVAALMLPWMAGGGALDTCSLNGAPTGTSGKCACDPGWTGEECDLLDVQPLRPPVSPVGTDAAGWPGYHNSSYNSWGGNAIYHNGEWHLFAAQFAEHCTLDTWGRNSEIVRATSLSPDGPFRYQERVIRAFAHNPTVRQAPDGTFVLFMIGSGDSPPGTLVNCSHTNVQSSGSDSSRHTRRIDSRAFNASIFVSSAPSVSGPWTKPEAVEFLGTSSQLWYGRSNPSPHFEPDGSLLLAFDSGPQNKTWAGTSKELLGIARSGPRAANDSRPVWLGPFTLVTPKSIVPDHTLCLAGVGEDPFLWRDKRGLKIIFHGMCPTGVMQAHYAWSADDGQTWTVSKRQTYSYVASWNNGSKYLFARVERPQLAFRPGTTIPMILWNGVCQGFGCLNLFGGKAGPSFTLARRLGSSWDE